MGCVREARAFFAVFAALCCAVSAVVVVLRMLGVGSGLGLCVAAFSDPGRVVRGGGAGGAGVPGGLGRERVRARGRRRRVLRGWRGGGERGRRESERESVERRTGPERWQCARCGCEPG